MIITTKAGGAGVLGDTVDAVMSTPVLTVELGESLFDAWQVLAVSGFRHLAVVDDDGACVGLLSDRVLLADVSLAADDLKRRRISTVIARLPVAVVSPRDRVLDVAHRMAALATGAVVVLDDAALVGIVTETDIVRWLAAQTP